MFLDFQIVHSNSNEETSDTSIYILKNFIFLQKNKSYSNFTVFNVSKIDRNTGQYESFEFNIKNKICNSSELHLNFIKNSLYSFFISVIEKTSDQKSAITIYELNLPHKNHGSIFENLQIPM